MVEICKEKHGYVFEAFKSFRGDVVGSYICKEMCGVFLDANIEGG